MIAKAEGKYIRMSASKARLVIGLVRGKTVEEAQFILANTNKGACAPITKILASVFANANYNRQEKFLTKDLCISKIYADGGPMLKRYRAATMGRATPIRHRTAHVRIELDETGEAKGKKLKEKSKAESSTKQKVKSVKKQPAKKKAKTKHAN